MTYIETVKFLKIENDKLRLQLWAARKAYELLLELRMGKKTKWMIQRPGAGTTKEERIRKVKK